MALEGLNAVGGAQVYNMNGSLNNFQKLVQQQQLQRQREQKALQDQLSKIKVEGVRDADKPELMTQYNNLKDTYRQILSERDQSKKMQLQSDLDKKFLELNDFTEKSRNYDKLHTDISTKLLDDKFRNQFTDDAVDLWQKSGNLPLNSKDIVKDPTVLARQIDMSKVQSKFSGIDEDLLKQTKYNNPKTREVKNGNKKGIEYTYTRSVDPKSQALNYAILYDTDREIKAYIQKQYAPLFDQLPEEEAKAQAIQDIVKQRPVSRQDAPKIDWERAPDNFYAHYDYRLNNPLTTGTVNEQLDARKKWIDDIKNGVSGSGEKLGAYIEGNPNFSNSSKFVIQYADAKDKSKGYAFDIPAQIKKTSDGDTVEVTPRRKFIINPNDPNYEIKINELINNVTGQRMDIGTSTGLKGNTKGTTTKVKDNSKSNGRVATKSQIKALIGKKGYEGYTEKELMDYYKSQGYTIQ